MSTAVKRFGPLLLWRGIDHTPRPWPRLLNVEGIGWVLLIEGRAFGIQLRRPVTERGPNQ